ncbi:MOSC domain-containing protein [Oculatella sp. LEGE 06141]|nr:MOSC domain-containing protein [Oculatella sp. LEGE 06141]
MVLSELNLYPIKSAAGISLSSGVVGARGFAGDRRWMLVDQTHTFMTQRRVSQMALITVQLDADRLVVAAPGMEPLAVAVPDASGDRIQVKVWRDICNAIPADESINQWFSQFLKQPCQLVYMPEDSIRLVDPTFAIDPSQDQVGFADASPFLLISEASLQDLNRRLDTPLPMNRFRPNLVVAGCEPYAEDSWRQIRIGSLLFHVVKPCSRCIITTIDQQTAIKGKEPLLTLSRYRMRNGEIFFGQNLLPGGAGTLNLGDPVEVLE